MRNIVLNKYGNKCAYCGAEITLKTMQIDHIHPKHLGGTDDISNYNPSCRSCNNRKATFSIEQFRAELELSHTRLLRDNTTYRIANRYGYIGKLSDNIKFHFETINNHD